MKLSAEQLNNNRYKAPRNITVNDAIGQLPSKKSLNFGTTLRIDRLVNDNLLSISGATKLTNKLDELFGDSFFSKKLSQADIKIQDDVFNIQKRTYWKIWSKIWKK